MNNLIDRRPNSRGKSAVNRERFLRRYKAQIQDAVKKMVGERRLADMEKGGEVRVLVEDGAPAIASVEDMVTIASLGGAWVARHGRHYRVLVGERRLDLCGVTRPPQTPGQGRSRSA